MYTFLGNGKILFEEASRNVHDLANVVSDTICSNIYSLLYDARIDISSSDYCYIN